MSAGEVRLNSSASPTYIEKTPTGIDGFDEITFGGVPRNRTSLILGGPGCGKTLFGGGFLCNGAGQYGEPGVFVALDQPREHILADLLSVGQDLEGYCSRKLVKIISPRLLSEALTETGQFTLDGFYAQIERAIKELGAKRVLIDGVDAFFAHFQSASALRDEFTRMSERLGGLGVTTVITGSARGASPSEHRLEEYISDCVILLDHRVIEQNSTRRLRVVKYRGTGHGTDEYPFVIDSDGLRVFPITSATLDYEVSDEHMTTGVADLDAILGGQGFYKGSSVLVAGHAGCGKTTLSAQFAKSVCAGGKRCVYFSMEESPSQIKRNMRQVGIDLEPELDSGALTLKAFRPSLQGLELHLSNIHRTVEKAQADAVIIDPVTNLIAVGSLCQVKAMLTRLLDDFKKREITVMLTSLISGNDETFGADIGISSLMDTIIYIQSTIEGRTRRRGLSVFKSRGVAHSHDIYRLIFSDAGIRLRAADTTGMP